MGNVQFSGVGVQCAAASRTKRDRRERLVDAGCNSPLETQKDLEFEAAWLT